VFHNTAAAAAAAAAVAVLPSEQWRAHAAAAILQNHPLLQSTSQPPPPPHARTALTTDPADADADGLDCDDGHGASRASGLASTLTPRDDPEHVLSSRLVSPFFAAATAAAAAAAAVGNPTNIASTTAAAVNDAPPSAPNAIGFASHPVSIAHWTVPPGDETGVGGGGGGGALNGSGVNVSFGDAHCLAIHMLQSVSAIFSTQAAAQRLAANVSAADFTVTPPPPPTSLPFASSRWGGAQL
jgi:hypothetical protein